VTYVTKKQQFEREIVAESQARREITDYILELEGDDNFKEEIEAIWSLEDYRRHGWAIEALMAFPKESRHFVQMYGRASEQS
jgi:hypothetical protein